QSRCYTQIRRLPISRPDRQKRTVGSGRPIQYMRNKRKAAGLPPEGGGLNKARTRPALHEHLRRIVDYAATDGERRPLQKAAATDPRADRLGRRALHEQEKTMRGPGEAGESLRPEGLS